MRPALRVARALLALGGAAALLVPAMSAHADTVGVQTTMANTFQPPTVTVNRGDSVLWSNNGGLNHTVTSTSQNWQKDDRITIVGQSTSYLFDKAGTYSYQCSTHPDTMKGSVIVRGPTVRPTRPPTVRPSTRAPSPTRTATTRPSSSATPSPSVASGTPVIGSVSPTPRPSAPPPLPTLAPAEEPSPSVYLGEGGLRPPPPTGRGKGLPVMLALLLVGGVGSAELRAVLASAPQ